MICSQSDASTPKPVSLNLVEPAWQIARLFPAQGAWTVEEYLALTNDTNHLVEFSQGYVEVLPMPTRRHQKVEHGRFERGTVAASALIVGLEVDVAAVFDEV